MLRSLSLLCTALSLILANLQISAQTTPPEAAMSALESEVRTIIDGHDNSVRANTLKIINAKTEQERQSYMASIPKPGEAARKTLEFIKAHPDDPAAIIGLNWVIERAANTPEGDAGLALLGEKYRSSSGIAPAVKSLQYQALEKAKPLLETIRDTNPNETEKAAAIFALGGLHFQQYENHPDPAVSKAAGEAAFAAYSELSSRYATVKVDGITLAETAGQMLFELANLTEGSIAPDIEGPDAEGTSFRLSEYRGRPVALIFWSDGCHACHDVLPAMEKAAAEFAAKKLAVLGVSGGDAATVKASLATNHATMRTWADGSTGGSINRLYNIRRFPTLYLLDAGGRILYKGTALNLLLEKVKQLP